MDKFKELPHTKADIKELEAYLKKNDLLDEAGIWFAGFPYNEGEGQNAIAKNLFYGNKKLKIVSVKGEDIYFIHNAKGNFSIYIYGKTSEKYNIVVKRKLLNPTIEIWNDKEERISLQINHNKSQVFEFKKKYNK